jgi:predicted nucleic acid-binding protein
VSDQFLLDSSALITLIEGEDGVDRVEKVLRDEECLLPWTVLLEVVYLTRRERGESEADHRYALIKQLPVKILWETDEPLILTAARLEASFRLSFADALIAAYAFQRNAILLHKDPEFEQLNGRVPIEALPYK